ncbi:MAG: hypothetical protein A2V83_05570 [Nitrospirae bacterium RBG_16_64_22]|nr:MAG: hypothetical protein A2V83_05570 [Nitrospirae bacterium RBG_16_64_22]
MFCEDCRVKTPEDQEVPKVGVEILGRTFQVPAGITAVDALWLTGHALERGVGCLGGVCGACTMLYTTPGSPNFNVGLGCRTVITEGMSFFPFPQRGRSRYRYDLSEVKDPAGELLDHFDRADKCRHCHGCTNVCPQKIQVEEAIELAGKGEFEKAGEMFLPCVMCGACLAECPEEMEPNHILLYARRGFAARLAPPPQELERMAREIREGRFAAAMESLIALSDEDLRALCEEGRG